MHGEVEMKFEDHAHGQKAFKGMYKRVPIGQCSNLFHPLTFRLNWAAHKVGSSFIARLAALFVLPNPSQSLPPRCQLLSVKSLKLKLIA